jgi:hypothetical protein
MYNFFIILILLYIVYVFFKINKISEHFGVPTGDERPFINIYDDTGEQIKVVVLSHPFTRDSSWKQYENYRKDNFIVLGISSYNEFPLRTSNKHDVLNDTKEKAWSYDYNKLIDGWLHCFRDPDKYIDPSSPKELISESDFCNYDVYKPDKNIKKIYDYIYVCPKDGPADDQKCDGWVSENKNWKLALKCIKIMSGKLGLKGILVGREGCELPSNCKHLLETTGWLDQSKLIDHFRKSKFILVPNQNDASPRILTEALCCDLPALLNYNIVGGWKYINDDNGALFRNIEEIEGGANFIMHNLDKMKPREQFLKYYGKENAGARLKEFIERNYSDMIDIKNAKYLKI